MNNEFLAIYLRQNKHMKKLLIPICLIAGMAVSSCKKDEKKAPSSTWTMDGTNYTSVSATKNSNAYAFAAASAATISFFFKAYPTSNGTYRINDDATLDADEVDIILGTPSPLMVGTPETTSKTVTVTISDGKVNIKCSDIPIKKENGAGGSLGTTTLSTDLTVDQ